MELKNSDKALDFTLDLGEKFNAPCPVIIVK